MGTRVRPSQLRQPPPVQRWQAERARRSARAASSHGQEDYPLKCVVRITQSKRLVTPGSQPWRWPADRQVILETLAAVRAENESAEAADGH